MQLFCIVSVDVEGIPLKTCNIDYSTVIDGIPILLDLFNEFNIHSTFFVTSDSAKNTTEVLKEITRRKHEIGCHGWGNRGHTYLKESTETIESCLNIKPIGFRAHRHAVKEGALMSLFKLGYKYDSSVVSSSKLLNREYSPKAPQIPYRIVLNNTDQGSEKSLIEIPISSLPIIKLPLTLSYARLFGSDLYRLFLTRLSQEVVTMYLHPYDIFPLPSNVDATSTFKLVHSMRNKGLAVLRSLFEFLAERFSPTYICAKAILNHSELADQRNECRV